MTVNDRVFNKDTNTWDERPNYIGCIAFGNYAEAIEPYLRKGLHVAIKGKLRYSQWEKDGAKRSKVEVVVEQMDELKQLISDVNDAALYDFAMLEERIDALERRIEVLERKLNHKSIKIADESLKNGGAE